jgi:hypothetical protein
MSAISASQPLSDISDISEQHSIIIHALLNIFGGLLTFALVLGQ